MLTNLNLPRLKAARFQLLHAVHNMSKKPLGLFWKFRPRTSNYNDSLYYNLIQNLTIWHKTRAKAEQRFTQILPSHGGQKKPAREKPCGGKSRQKIWVGTMA